MQENQINDGPDDKSMFLKDFEGSEKVEIPASDFLSKEDERDSKNKQIADSGNITQQQEETQEQYQKESKEDGEIKDLSQENSPLKKYIMYIAREFVPIIDSMTIDQRIAYINDAIQIKIDNQKEKELKSKKNQFIIHLIIIISVFILSAPFALYIANKAIMLTFENYKYSQENFEKLYKQRFEKDSAYIRSLQYNRKHSIKQQ